MVTEQPMIIEGLVTTTSLTGQPHVAPMGPVVDSELRQWQLRPFQSSSTFANLQRHPVATFHVVDDVLPVVQSALNMSVDLQFDRHDSGGWFIPSACHWYRLRVVSWDLSHSRAELRAEVEESVVLRPFWGWNRAKHAVLEATILATRLHLRGPDQIVDHLAILEAMVQKTAGASELQAWHLVQQYIKQWKS